MKGNDGMTGEVASQIRGTGTGVRGHGGTAELGTYPVSQGSFRSTGDGRTRDGV